MSDTDRANLTVAADVPPAERAALAVELAAVHAADALRELGEGKALSWGELRPSVAPLVELFQTSLVSRLATDAGPEAEKFLERAREFPALVPAPIEQSTVNLGKRSVTVLKRKPA